MRSADGYGLDARVTGEGEPVLLGLHGGPGGHGGEYLAPLHRLSGPDRRVVIFDQLATGASQIPPGGYEWSVERAVADVEAVRNQLNADRLDLFGHSWGGMLALQYALDNPDRVRRLVLSNTASSVARITATFLRQLLERYPLSDAVAAITADVLLDHRDPRFRAVVRVYLDGEEALDLGPAGAGLWGPHVWFATAALRDWDVEDRLREIEPPTLILHGGADMSDHAINRALADGIPDSEWITLNGRGHTLFDDVHLAIVATFLNGWREK
jgi:proline iminopeptidase